jgi:hypothetical protein
VAAAVTPRSPRSSPNLPERARPPVGRVRGDPPSAPDRAQSRPLRQTKDRGRATACSKEILDHLKGWMAQTNAAIMALLCLIIGAKLIGDGISGF